MASNRSDLLAAAVRAAERDGAEATASHLPVLHEFLTREPGSLLELGGGVCSTPFIRSLLPDHRVLTLESNWRWARRIRKTVGRDSADHHLRRVRDWDRVDWDDLARQHWHYVFVDHAPGERRVADILRLIDHCDFVIVHDTDADRGKGGAYGWSAIESVPRFWREYMETDPLPSTSVCSNRRDPADVVPLF